MARDGRVTIGGLGRRGRRVRRARVGPQDRRDKRKAKDQLTEGDYERLRKVIGYARRHLAQGGPDNDKEHSRWRYSLMNWAHDPIKRH